MNRKQHIDIAINIQSDQVKSEYRLQFTATIDYVRFLLEQGLAFRGHDEAEASKNRGNFLELIKFLSNHSTTINDAFKNAPNNDKLVAPSVQKDITNACALVTTRAIISELGDKLLPVATATVERAFSAMKIVKRSLRNRMGDTWMNDSLLTHIEKELFESVSTEDILQQFQEMKTRRISL